MKKGDVIMLHPHMIHGGGSLVAIGGGCSSAGNRNLRIGYGKKSSIPASRFEGVRKKMWVLRKILSPMGTTDAMEFLLDKLKSSKNTTQP